MHYVTRAHDRSKDNVIQTPRVTILSIVLPWAAGKKELRFVVGVHYFRIDGRLHAVFSTELPELYRYTTKTANACVIRR